MTSDDGKERTIQQIDYISSDTNPKNGKGFSFGKMEFVEENQNNIVQGDILVKK